MKTNKSFIFANLAFYSIFIFIFGFVINFAFGTIMIIFYL